MILSLSKLGSSLALALVLAGASRGVQQTEAELKQAFDAIQKEYDVEFREMRKATEGLPREEAASIYADFFANVLPDFSERFAVIARANQGTPVAFDAWSRVISFGSTSSTRSERGSALLKEALDALTKDHIQSEALTGLASNLRYSADSLGEELVVTTLEDIAARTPHRSVEAAALFTLGAVLGDERAEGDPRLARAKTIFQQLRAEFAEVVGRDGRTYAEAAGAYLFALENLAVGKPCPDFTAVDVEGASFKLSDYKGKVVLLDFWGFW
jgi:hypothetical protein